MKLLKFASLTVIIAALTGCPVPDCTGPDPEAQSIEYRYVEDDPAPSTAVVEIEGIVENTGMADFNSNPGQQVLQLFEDQQMVAEQPFENLSVGETVSVTYQRVWSSTTEFKPQKYVLKIIYDPDIAIDGNPENDDCNTGNNEVERDTSGLDALV